MMSPELEAAEATAYCDCIRLHKNDTHARTENCVTVSSSATVLFQVPLPRNTLQKDYSSVIGVKWNSKMRNMLVLLGRPERETSVCGLLFFPLGNFVFDYRLNNMASNRKYISLNLLGFVTEAGGRDKSKSMRYTQSTFSI